MTSLEEDSNTVLHIYSSLTVRAHSKHWSRMRALRLLHAFYEA